MRFWGPLSFAALCIASAPAVAQDFGVSEIRGGPALSSLELLPQLFFVPDTQSLNVAKLDSAQFDVLFRSPELDVFRWLGSPRPSIGTVISLSGHESLVHAGLDWHVPLGSSAFYLEAGLGVGIHNGYLNNAPAGYRDLGCRTLIHWEYGAGVNLSDKVTLTAQWQHMSDFMQCSPNQGLNNIGLVLGWKF